MTFRAATNTTVGAAAPSITLSVPPGTQVGDTLFAIIASSWFPGITPTWSSAQWTADGGGGFAILASNASTKLGMDQLVVAGSPPASYTFDLSSNGASVVVTLGILATYLDLIYPPYTLAPSGVQNATGILPSALAGGDPVLRLLPSWCSVSALVSVTQPTGTVLRQQTPVARSTMLSLADETLTGGGTMPSRTWTSNPTPANWWLGQAAMGIKVPTGLWAWVTGDGKDAWAYMA